MRLMQISEWAIENSEGRKVKIWENPTKNVIHTLLKNHGELRGFIDFEEQNNIILWWGYLEHRDVAIESGYQAILPFYLLSDGSVKYSWWAAYEEISEDAALDIILSHRSLIGFHKLSS